MCIKIATFSQPFSEQKNGFLNFWQLVSMRGGVALLQATVLLLYDYIISYCFAIV